MVAASKSLLRKHYYSCTTRGPLPVVRTFLFAFDANSSHPRSDKGTKRHGVVSSLGGRNHDPNFCPSASRNHIFLAKVAVWSGWGGENR